MPPQSSKWIALSIISVVSFLMPFETSMLFIAVPRIAAAFKDDLGLVTWVPTAALIAVTAFSIPLGRLSDLWGRRRLYLGGVTFAGLVALAAGSAQSSVQLIGLRLMTGFCSALISANAWAIISEIFPSRERGKALGINTACVFTGLSSGPVVGGLLINYFGTWRATFYSAAPFYFLLAMLAFRFLPETVRARKQQSSDLTGAVSFISGLGLLMLALTLGRKSGWMNFWSFAALGASALMMALFAYVELRVAEHPMLDLKIFGRNLQFTLGNLSTLFHYISAHQGLTILISFYVQWVLNRSAAMAGIITLAKYLTMAVFSPFCGYLSDRMGPRWLCTLGMGFIFVSLVLLSCMGPQVTLVSLFLQLSLLGVGIGLFASPNINFVLSSLPKDKLGTASGTLNTFRSLGGALGLVMVGGMLSGGSASAGFSTQLKTAFMALSAVALLGVAVSALRGNAPAHAGEQSNP